MPTGAQLCAVFLLGVAGGLARRGSRRLPSRLEWVGLGTCLAILFGVGAASAAPASTFDVPAFVSYIEWVLDVRLCAAERSEVDAVVLQAQTSSNPDDRKLVSRAIELEAERKSHSDSELAALRWSVEDEYLKTLKGRYRASKVAQWILRLKSAASRPLVAGTPPLTRHVCDCAAELGAFVASEVRGAPIGRDVFARELTAAYAHLTDGEKATVAAAPRDWQRIRARWADAPEEERSRWRESWRTALGVDGGVAIETLSTLAHALARIAAVGSMEVVQ